VLFASNLAIWTSGNGLIPLLPLRAIDLGLKPSFSGVVMSLFYLLLVIGTVAAIPLICTVQSKSLLVCISIAHAATYLGLAASKSYEHLVVFGGISWFCFGVEICVLRLYAAALAPKYDRGSVLGLLFVTSPLGALIGGSYMGNVAQKFGFQLMLSCTSLLFLFLTFTAFLLPSLTQITHSPLRRFSVSKDLWAFICINFVISTVGFAARAATPVLMRNLGRPDREVGLTVASAGVAGLIGSVLFGRFSDQYGRVRVLLIIYSSTTLGALLLSRVSSNISFQIAAALIGLFSYGGAGVRTALATEIAPIHGTASFLSLVESSTWAGAIAGFAFGGAVAGSAQWYIFAMPLLGVGCTLGLFRWNQSRASSPVLSQ